MVCHGKGQASILGPTDKLPQDENKTKRAHMVVGYSHVILVTCGVRVFIMVFG